MRIGIGDDPQTWVDTAAAFRALGADLAVTYLNDRAKKHVEPLAKEIRATEAPEDWTGSVDIDSEDTEAQNPFTDFYGWEQAGARAREIAQQNGIAHLAVQNWTLASRFASALSRSIAPSAWSAGVLSAPTIRSRPGVARSMSM